MESDTRKLKICMNVKNVRRNAKIAKGVVCLGSGYELLSASTVLAVCRDLSPFLMRLFPLLIIVELSKSITCQLYGLILFHGKRFTWIYYLFSQVVRVHSDGELILAEVISAKLNANGSITSAVEISQLHRHRRRMRRSAASDQMAAAIPLFDPGPISRKVHFLSIFK